MTYTATAILVVAIFVLAAVVAISNGWGASEIGSASSWFAAITTTAAVVVALRSSHVARISSERAITTADDRAEEERKYSHRRETTKAVAELWATTRALDAPLSRYSAQVLTGQPLMELIETGHDKEHDARLRLDDAFMSFEAKLFYAKAIALEPHLIAELRILEAQIDALRERLHNLPEVRSIDAKREIDDAFGRIIARQHNALETVRRYLPLLRGAEEERRAEEQFISKHWDASSSSEARLDTT